MRLLRFTFVFLISLLSATAEPERWAAAIDELTARDAQQPPAPGGVVFVGSSSIVLWKTLRGDFPGQNVIQRGFGGSELADSVFYANRIVTPYRPSAVVLYAGDNDLQNGKTPEQVAADFQAFVQRVHADVPQARIVFIAIKPSPSRWHLQAEGQRANALIAAACAEDPKRLRFVDIWTPMLGADGTPRPELFVEDKLHLSQAGYDLWAPLVRAALAR